MVCVLLLVVGCDNPKPTPGSLAPVSGKARPAPSQAREVDISHLGPGKSASLVVAGRTVEIAVPAGEGFTFGSFQIAVPATGFSRKKLERDGSLNRIWIGDVTSDGIEDMVIVIKSGGSGSYADVFLLETVTTNFVISRLPEFTTPGYMGHDVVSVQNGAIVRSFPTYIDDDKVRLDRQYKPNDLLRGKSPVRKKPDSNATPSGSTKTFRFDVKRGWVPL